MLRIKPSSDDPDPKKKQTANEKPPLKLYDPVDTIKPTEQTEFFNEYLNSKNYRARLKKQGYSNPTETISNRKKFLSVPVHQYRALLGGSQHTGEEIAVDEGQARGDYDYLLKGKGRTDFNTLLAHEFSHRLGAHFNATENRPQLNQKEYDEILNRNNIYRNLNKNPVGFSDWAKSQNLSKDEYDHDLSPAENKADIDALRFLLRKDKIYNTGTETFTPELLKTAKEKYKENFNANRLFRYFDDADIIYLMNNIAKNENQRKFLLKVNKDSQA